MRLNYLVAMAVSFSCYANITAAQQNAGIKFNDGNWQRSVEKAAKENKIIFLECNAAWCGPCKRMEKNVFSNKKAGSFFNNNFVNYTVNIDSGEGKELSKRYGITSLPAMLYLKPGGYIIEKVAGYKDVDSLLLTAKFALKKRDSVTLREQFDTGNRDAAFLKHFIKSLAFNEPPGWQVTMLDTIIRQEGYEAFLKKKYWDLMALAPIESPLAKWFLAHRSDFVKAFGDDAVNAKIADMYLSIKVFNALAHSNKGGKEIYKNYKEIMQGYDLPELPFLFSAVDFLQACKDGEVDKGLANCDTVLANARPWQYHLMARWANWLIINQQQERFHAAQWSAKAAALSTDAFEKEQCKKITDNLLNDITPTVYPAPKVYGYDI